MDSRIKGRFYRLSEAPNGQPEFADILLAIMAGGAPSDRERDLGGGVTLRLEQCDVRDQLVEGDFCRVQRVNIPPQAGAAGLVPIQLNDGHGIGHLGAFIYHRPTRVMLLQSNMQSATPNRVALYVATDDPMRIFSLRPVLTDDAIDRFRAGRARSFSVKFAGIDRLDVLDDPDIPAARGARMIADAYDGLDVEIKVSVGRSRDHWLAQGGLLASIGRLMGEPGVEKLQAKMEGDDHPLDLLHEQLQAESELELPEGDPARHYAVRRQFLRETLGANMPLIQRQFGAPDGHGRR
ncbi:DUF6731 family protein [Phenylobacterium sp.]|uniref:DUF6731 family protein n=1 Tax=Phenylobacterium sp. TaxID=1871053 RepID=UPI0030F3E9EF